MGELARKRLRGQARYDNAAAQRYPTQAIEMSSTEVRNTVAHGGDFSGMVPQGVAEYIREKGLYR